jgi:aldehyde:ferredoxin oxidoreductase
MGMGAVMGSKNLKAVVVRGRHRPPLRNEQVVTQMTSWYAANMRSNEVCKSQLDLPGFSLDIHAHSVWGMSLPVNNYRESVFRHLEGYRPKEVERFYVGDAACAGCPNNCIKIVHAASPETPDARASGLHQEAIGSLGPNLGLPELRPVLQANNMCNQLGLDPTSLGFSMSFAMECVEEGVLSAGDVPGGFRFGATEVALKVMRDVAFRDGFGDLLAGGSKRAAETIGRGAEKFALHVKGLETEPWDPRSQTNLGLGYAVAAFGPRHDVCEHDADWDADPDVGFPHSIDSGRTLGVLGHMPMDHYGPDKVHRFKALSDFYSAADALGACIFAVDPSRLLTISHLAELVEATTGWDSSAYEVMTWGERRHQIMRMYNHREGLTAGDDDLPERFYHDPNPVGPRTGRGFDRKRFREVIDFYYQMMGWDTAGFPLPATISRHHLDGLVADQGAAAGRI